MISVVLPASGAAGAVLVQALMPLVPAAADGAVREVLVVADEGGEAAAVAEAAGCRLLDPAGSLPADFRAGAAAARSSWLLFLLPGAVLEGGWHHEAAAFIDRAGRSPGRERAAAFRHARDTLGWRSRLGEAGAALRSRLLAAPAPEQGLLVPAALYRRLGGHRELAGLSGIDLARRIGRRRLSLMRASAVLGGEPAGGGAALRRALCLALLLARVPPRLLARLAA